MKVLLQMLVLAAALTGQSTDDERDCITLTNGKQLRGRVVLELEDRVVLRVRSRERVVDSRDITSIASVARSLREMLDVYRALPKATAAELVVLARECEDRALPHEAELFRWRAVLVDPECGAAHAALGHEQRGGEWRMRVGPRWCTLAEAQERHAEWGDAWELRSEHFRVRCDSGLERSVHTLLELEYCYRYFLDAFQRELELRELVEPIAVYVYRNRDQFPSQGTHVGAYFAQAENVLYTYVAGRGRPVALFHEATHAILHNTAERASGSRGSLPAWLDEGWADYMEAVVVPEGDGRARFEAKRRNERNVAVLERLGEDDAYTVHRVLNFKASDYAASTGQGAKYAQGYGLFVLLWEGDGYREKFVEYVREALAGQGQASSFRRVFRRELEEIEREHLHVR